MFNVKQGLYKGKDCLRKSRRRHQSEGGRTRNRQNPGQLSSGEGLDGYGLGFDSDFKRLGEAFLEDPALDRDWTWTRLTVL